MSHFVSLCHSKCHTLCHCVSLMCHCKCLTAVTQIKVSKKCHCASLNTVIPSSCDIDIIRCLTFCSFAGQCYEWFILSQQKTHKTIKKTPYLLKWSGTVSLRVSFQLWYRLIIVKDVCLRCNFVFDLILPDMAQLVMMRNTWFENWHRRSRTVPISSHSMCRWNGELKE